MATRPAAPKAEDYSVVPGSLGPRRDFRISVGLRGGWDADGRVFDVSEAVRTARAWMKRRVEAGRPALSGMFTRAEVTYAWPRADGTVGSDREPAALFTGEAVHAYLGLDDRVEVICVFLGQIAGIGNTDDAPRRIVSKDEGRKRDRRRYRLQRPRRHVDDQSLDLAATD